MYRDVAQWAMIRRKVFEDGVPRRQLVRETGISRNTIRKMLLHKLPQPCGLRTPQHPRLGPHIKRLDELASLNELSPPEFRLSVTEIYKHLQREERYSGSYGAVRGYLKFRLSPCLRADLQFWSDLYEMIVSLEKFGAIAFLRALSCNEGPLIPSARVRKFQREVECLRQSGGPGSRRARIEECLKWIYRVLRREIPLNALRKEFDDLADLPEILDRLYGSRLTFRNRAMAVLAHFHGVSDHVIAAALKITRQTARRCRRHFQAEGAAGLFAPKRRAGLKTDDEGLKTTIFGLLHEPPSNHGINRTSWTMAHLCDMLAKQGKPACPNVVAAITKAAGYKWRKARVVLTSNDPDYAEKLARIRSVLSGLQPDEAFFSIDEFGPFSVKAKPGRTLTAPGEQREVAQWQKSKGCLILTAALELSGNQVTHFYSLKKNTTEMIRMMELLLERYKDKRKLYLSWDAASWHISKRLSERIRENNQMVAVTSGPLVETAPLPARAQFLNVIEFDLQRHGARDHPQQRLCERR